MIVCGHAVHSSAECMYVTSAQDNSLNLKTTAIVPTTKQGQTMASQLHCCPSRDRLPPSYPPPPPLEKKRYVSCSQHASFTRKMATYCDCFVKTKRKSSRASGSNNSDNNDECTKRAKAAPSIPPLPPPYRTSTSNRHL